jgi:helicase MOV-10
VQPHGASPGLWYEGYVHVVHEKEVRLKFNKLFKTSQAYHVRFKLSRITIMRQHYALDTKNQQDRILFPTTAHASSASRREDAKKRKFSFFNNNIANNEQQQLAIRSIVRLPPGSPPFILFGPYVDP